MVNLFGKNPFGKKSKLVSAFQAGEQWAFSEIYAKFHKPVSRYVAKSVRDEAQAQDLTQEIFLKVHRFRESYDSKYEFSTWLWAIARNTVIDSFRQKDPTTQALGAEAMTEDDLPCPLPDAEALLAHKMNRRMLMRLTRNLTRLQKRVVWMRVIYQLPYNEIAKRLGLSISAVKCLAYRSKQLLGKSAVEAPAVV